jgi:putative aminopeptidase FrvX
MDANAREFLDTLLMTPSPSGQEQKIQRLIHQRMKEHCQSIEPDLHGNLILGINSDAKRRVLIDGHCDQIGFTVKYIDPQGYIYVDPLGGVDESVLMGERMTIHTRSGPILGVFGKKAVHLQTPKETAQVPLPKDMWIDIGANSADEVRECVSLGDYITFQLHINHLAKNKIQAPGLDNKIGLFVVLETLRRCAREKLDVAVFALSAVQEELGSRGAVTATSRLSPEVGITVDVTNASDDPGNTQKSTVPCLLGKGPCISRGPNTNPVVSHMLCEAAKRLKVPFQISPSAQLAGNDSKAIQTADSGVATADVSIPQRNMHTQAEVCSLDDVDCTVELLVEFLRSIRPETDFRPFHASFL